MEDDIDISGSLSNTDTDSDGGRDEEQAILETINTVLACVHTASTCWRWYVNRGFDCQMEASFKIKVPPHLTFGEYFFFLFTTNPTKELYIFKFLFSNFILIPSHNKLPRIQKKKYSPPPHLTFRPASRFCHLYGSTADERGLDGRGIF